MKEDLDFYDGVWYAVQFLVIEHDQPTMAKEIAKGAGINQAKAMSLQMVSGYEDIKMLKFIRKVVYMMKWIKYIKILLII